MENQNIPDEDEILARQAAGEAYPFPEHCYFCKHPANHLLGVVRVGPFTYHPDCWEHKEINLTKFNSAVNYGTVVSYQDTVRKIA